jgi:hypothetical protein
LLRSRKVAESEAHGDALRSEGLRVDAVTHVPHEHGDVEVLAIEFGTHPALAPFSELADDRCEFPARFGEEIFRTARAGPAADDAEAFELLEAAAQQGAGHQRHAAMHVVEVTAAAEEGAQDQWRPALRKDFCALRDRAVLAIRFHASSVAAGCCAGESILWTILAHRTVSVWRR